MSTNTLPAAHVTADEKTWLLSLVTQATQTVNAGAAVLCQNKC